MKRWLLFLLYLSWEQCAIGLDPTKKITQYIHNVWQTETGLPQNSILSITQDRDGYLWFGTEQGLVRFDGVKFTVFDKTNTPGLKNDYIDAIYEDRQGHLWLSTDAGFTKFSNGAAFTYDSTNGLSHDVVHTIMEDHDGSLWIGTDIGLNRFTNGKFKIFRQKDGLSDDHVRKLLRDRNGNIWLAGFRLGLTLMKEGKFTSFTEKNGLLSNTLYTLAEDLDGNLWIGTSKGVNLLKNGKFISYTTKDGLSDDQIRSICPDKDGNIWIATYGGGLNRLRNGKIDQFTNKDGLTSDLVVSLFEDREGSLWIGTYGGGLNRLQDSKFVTYTTKEGLSNDNVRAITEDVQGNVWIGTYGGGLNRYKDGTFTTYTTKEGLSHDIIRSLYADPTGSLWIGSYTHLNRLSNGKFLVYTVKDGLAFTNIRALAGTDDGSVLIGTALGGSLNFFQDGRFKKLEGIPIVFVIHEAKNGDIWIGTRGGLYLLKNDKLTKYTTREGLSNNVVFSIHEEEDGTLWIGTYGGGINRFKDGKFVSFRVKDGLHDDLIFQILEDQENFWISSNKGIFRVYKSELQEFANQKIQSIRSIAYGISDGMKTRECNAGNPAGWKTKDGKLWFATIKGVVVIDPKKIKTNAQPPPVRIEQVFADDRLLDSKDNSFGPGEGKLEFRYTALSFLAPEKIKFEYQLDGFDKHWIDGGNRRIAYYTNIPPGNYTFKVRACNNDGLWNKSGAAFSLYLKPHFYQSYWFYGLCVLSVVLLGWQVHRYRLNRLLEVERIRTRIATDLHDDIGAGLTQIAILSEVLRGDENPGVDRAKSSLMSIAQSSRELIDSMSDIVWAVDPQKDRLVDLIFRMRRFANDLLSGKEISFSFKTSATNDQKELDPLQKRHIYLLFKESIHNLVRHSGCTKAELSVNCEKDLLKLRVLDNGKGYDPSALTVGDAWIQFKIQYYLYALVFIVFDVEVVLILPWAVVFKQLGFFAFVEMAIFLLILFIGLIYVWRKRDLEWY